jgi:hypothetical protein
LNGHPSNDAQDRVSAARTRYPATDEPDHGAQPTRAGHPGSPAYLPATKGKPEIHEKRLRPIAAILNWEDQRKASRRICNEVAFPFTSVGVLIE